MKKVLYLALAVVATAFATSCVKELADGNQENTGNKPEIEITGQVFEAKMEATKSVIDGKTPTWVEGDAISVFGSNETAGIECTFAGEGKFQVNGDKVVEGPFYAIYPHKEGHSVDQNTGIFTATVPAEQLIKAGENTAAGALVAVAASETPEFYFRNAVGLVRLENKREDIVSIKIESTTADQVIAGEFTMDLNPDKETENEDPAITLVEGKGATSITLKPAEENGTLAAGEYYATLLPCAIDGIKVTFTRKNGEKTEPVTVTKAKETTIPRNGGADLGAFFTYEIKNAQELLAWNKAAAKWTAWDVVTLTDNIDCADVITSENWEPHGFTGTFDGNGKTINNMVIEKEGPAGFFAQMSGSAFAKNLTFGEGCSFTSVGANAGGRVYAASLVCEIKGNAGLDNITNYATIVGNHSGTKSKGNYIAGICCSLGGDKATVSNCKNYGSVTFSATPAVWTCVGGILGESPSKGTTVTNCENYGAILFNGPSNGGNSINLAGIAGGANLVSFDGCSNFGKVEYNAQEAAGGGINIGGIVGHNNSAAIPSLTNCTNGSATDNTLGEIVVSGATGGEIRMGGCVGYVQEVATIISGFKNYGKLYNSVSTAGAISMGGVVGRVYKTTNTITSCENNGTITNAAKTITTAYMGGLVGWVNTANTSISNASNKGAVTNSATAASTLALGGICGEIDNTTDNSISSCENHGVVTNSGVAATAYVGGVAGWLNTVSTSFDKVSNVAVITNSSKNTTNTAVGGVIGYISGSNGNVIKNAENKAKVHNSATNYVKGVTSAVGGVIGIIENCSITIGDSTKDGVKNSGEVTSGQYYDMGLGGVVAKILDTDAGNNNVVKNCLNTGNIQRSGWSGDKNVTGDGIGGIIGFYYSTVASNVTIEGSTNNGLVAKTGGTTSNMHIGGIAGAMYGASAYALISECTNANMVNYDTGTEKGNSKYAYTGGIAGYFQPKGEIKSCTNSGTVVSKVHTSAGNDDNGNPRSGYLVRIGGIVGDFNGTKLTSCTNNGTVKDESTSNTGRVGGIAGGINTVATLYDCNNNGTVSCCFDSESRTSGTVYKRAEVHMGGISGYMASNITLEKCNNSGTVTNYCKKNTYGKTKIGGFAGLCYAISFKNCTNTGTITNSATDTKEPYVAGFVGQIEQEVTTSIIDCSYNANVIPGVSTYTLSGILVGRLTDKITNGDKTCTTTVSGVTVKGKFNNIDLTADNYGTYTFGTSSDYGKKSGHATSGITFAE